MNPTRKMIFIFVYQTQVVRRESLGHLRWVLR